MAYGSIDDQSSPTNVKPQPASRGNSGRAMGDIDAAASPSSQNSPEDPGKMISPLTSANYGGINSLVYVNDLEATGTTMRTDNASFNDDVAQYRKGDEPRDHAELMRIRNQAYNAVGPTQDNANPPFIGKQDSDPLGG